jgi:hypothetical protein
MGNTNCGGCGLSNLMQMLRHAVADRRVQLVIPACCGAVAAGTFPSSTYGVPTLMTTFASAAASASGIASVAQLNGEDTRVICVAGDGGTYDIGFATLSAAAERNEDILYICYDNEIYGNTGGQRSSATRRPAPSPATCRRPSRNRRRTSSPSWPRTGLPMPHRSRWPTPRTRCANCAARSTSRVSAFCTCWHPARRGGNRNRRWAWNCCGSRVRSGLFPVLEIFDGRRHVINIEPDFSDEALDMYLSLQRRFQKSGISAADLRPAIDRHWQNLRQLSGRIVPARRTVQ